MDTWNVLNKDEYPEEFSGIVHHDEGTTNFSVQISTILHSSAYTGGTQFKSYIRLPYVCIYFDNVVLITSNSKCEDVVLFKLFDSNICSLIILQESDKLAIILEDRKLCTVNLITKELMYSETCLLDDKFSGLCMYELESGNIILASSGFMYHNLSIIPEDNNLKYLQFIITRVKLSELDENALLEIELLQRNIKKTTESAICFTSSSGSNISAICPITQQEIQVGDRMKVKYILPFLDNDKLLLLKEKSVGQYNLCIANLFSYDIEFNIKVSENCFVVAGITDTAIYLDIKDNRLCVYQIRENSPLSQLEILISARKYEEAEAFAKLNNLSPTAVLELKAKFLLNNLKKVFSNEVLLELQEILSSCNNIQFIVNCCVEGAESNVKLSALLQFVKKYLPNFDDPILKARIDELLWKTDVFILLQYEDNIDAMEWREFIEENTFLLCKRLLSNNELDHACILWMKCFPYIGYDLLPNKVSELLFSISSEASIRSLLLWLENFVPSVINIMPYAGDIIVNWATDRICSLENTKCWPEIAIQLAENLTILMFNVKVTINFIPTAAEKFYHLIYCLKNIQTLKNLYNIVVSLRDFMTLCPNELASLILRKAFTEDLNVLLSNFIDKFVVRHGINNDALIREHIEELLKISPVIDENKMEILLKFIHRTEERMHCVLLVLKSANIPWTEKINKIAQNAIDSQHVLALKIRMEVVHAEIKSILMKYKCHELSSEDYEYLIRLIVNKGDSDMLADIDKVTGVYRSLRDDAYLLCIQKYLTCSEIHTALKLFYSMKENFQQMCVNTILLKLESLLFTGINSEVLEYNHLDFLKSLNLLDKNTLDALRSVYELKNRFQLRISLSDYCIEDYRRFFFTDWCKDKKNKNSKNFQELLTKTCQVASYLKIPKSESILILLEHVNGDSQKSIANIIFSKESCILDETAESISLIVKLLSLIDVFDIFVLDNILKYVLKLIQKCNSKYLTYCIDVCSWLFAIYFSHNNTKEILSTWKITSFYNPHVISSIIPLWNEIFLKNTTKNFSSKNLIICLCKDEKKCNDGSECLKGTLMKLQSQQNDLYFTRLAAYFIINHFQNDSPLPSWFVELNDYMLKNLVSKMLVYEQPDHLLISMLLFSHSSPIEWLADMLSKCGDSHRKITVAQYILKCKEIFHHVSIPYKQAFIIYSQNNIASKLENYGITLKDWQQDEMCNVNSLLESLVNIESFNILTLEELCIVTGVSLDSALIFYLFSILKTWNSNYDILQDDFGHSYVYVKPCSSDLLLKCLNIVQRISCKNVLIDNLSTLFLYGEINFQNLTTINLSQYSYEVYLFIIELLNIVTGNQMFWREFLLLKFLQTYKRITKPKQSELDIYSMKETFPKIGYYRLPFHSLISNDVWDNLKIEVTLSTYSRWLSVASLLPLGADFQVQCDMICSNAVRQSMTSERIKNSTEDVKWSLHLKNDHLLKQAYRCIQNITNLEWAGACFYHVFRGSLFGADQVAASDLCYQFAEHWAKVEPDEKVFKKMQSKHLLSSTVHILNKIGLQELLPLCTNPRGLIDALYNHDIILKPNECSDINAAVDEIAEKNGLNAASERMSILEKILNETRIQSSHIKSRYVDDGTLSRDTLAKACYILKGTNPMMAALYLSRIGLDDSHSSENYNNKIRALQCLLSLVETDVIEKVTNFTVVELWSKLWELYFINSLHQVSLEFLTSTFLEDKKQAIQQIWHAREHNNLTISLIMKIIAVYNLQLEDDFIDSIIKSMLKFDMTLQMKEFLQRSKLCYGNNYVEAWSNVLLNPFKRLDTPLMGNQQDECYSTLQMLPTCPILSQIDFSPIWTNLIQLGASEMAATFLPHLSSVEQKRLISKLGKMQVANLQKIKTLKTKGVTTTNIVLSILKREYSRSK